MAQTNEFEDRVAIRELIDRWSDAVNERDWKALATCFTDDGEWNVGQPFSFDLKGNDAIVQSVSTEVEKQSFVIQTGHSVVIQVHGDTATARSTMHEFMRNSEGVGMQMWGTYYDDLLRTVAGWRFKRREFRVALFDAKAPVGDFLRNYREIS